MPAKSAAAMASFAPRRSARLATTGSVWVARHGQRIDQADGDWWETASRPHDPYLTELGMRQAEAAGRELASQGVDDSYIVYSSPFLRCVQTAQAIARELGVGTIRIEPGLAELLCGPACPVHTSLFPHESHEHDNLCFVQADGFASRLRFTLTERRHEEWFDFGEGYRSGMPMDAGMSMASLTKQFGKLIDATYKPFLDAPERSGQLAPSTEVIRFPEEWHEGVDRYERTLTALRKASPRCVLVTHGAGVQACAESCPGIDMADMDIDYCCLTNIWRQGEVEQWKCGMLASAAHTADLD